VASQKHNNINMIKLKPLNEQAVVILGASSGIGRATALRFAEKGANLLVAARSTKGIESLVKEIRAISSRSPGANLFKVEGLICDVADFEQVKMLAKKCYDLYGRIDTWVQPAGITLFAEFEDTTEEEMR
jgi:NAD(P)-dependent dehydrogenase (short-subunit alcohol dehydrogenase family)